MRKLRNDEKILTVPNLISLFRLLLIPFLIHLCLVEEDIAGTAILLTVSAASDIADGWIARRTGQVTQLGKVLDPVADKLTQGAMFCCLAHRFERLRCLLFLFMGKEAIMAGLGYLALKRRNTVNSARWYGKANTIVLFGAIVILLLFPDMEKSMVNGVILAAGMSMAVSLILYIGFYIRFFRKTAGNAGK